MWTKYYCLNRVDRMLSGLLLFGTLYTQVRNAPNQVGHVFEDICIEM